MENKILPMSQRLVIRLTYLGYRQAEIAELLDIKPATVKATRAIAYKKLGINSLKEIEPKMFKRGGR